ncbi:hypothetical protein [Brassicibacter mesophilus]|uniref:hypothetical protein n=1 Tax=Brassicibacter mesophilus TaxID=745119 RepID=UPI003D218246
MDKNKLERLQELIDKGYKRIDSNYKLTRGTRELITNAITENKTKNRYELCKVIADELEGRYKGKCLDYQLERMNLETTGDILRAIDTYMFKHYKKSIKDKIE